MEISRTNWFSIVATAMLTNPAGVLGAIAPAIIMALTLEAHLTLAMATKLVAVEFAAMTVAMVLVPVMKGRIGERALATMAMASAVGALLVTLTGDVLLVLPARCIIGFAEGTLYGLAISTLARTSYPDRAFGIVVFSNQVVSALLLASATWAHLRFPSFGIFALLLLFLILTAFCVPAISTEKTKDRESPSVTLRDFFSMLPMIAGILLFAIAFGGIWPVITVIAQARGIAEVEIGHALALAGLAGILGATYAILLADRIGRIVPLILGSIGLAIALFGGFNGPFGIAAPAMLFLWSFLVPYYLGSAADADRAGRLVVVAGAMLPFGIAVGQTLAGLLLEDRAFRSLSLLAALITSCALICMMVPRWTRSRSSTQASG